MEHDIAIDIDSHSLTLEEVLEGAKVDVNRFPAADREDTTDHFERAGLAPGSLLSNLLRRSDGVLIAKAWFRVFGVSDQACGRTLCGWNQTSLWKAAWGPDAEGMLAFADDPLGNQFAINLGVDGTGNWKVMLGLRESRTWIPLEVTFGQWLEMVLAGDAAKFYAELPYSIWRGLHEGTRTLPAEGLDCEGTPPSQWTPETVVTSTPIDALLSEALPENAPASSEPEIASEPEGEADPDGEDEAKADEAPAPEVAASTVEA